ncbi:MAG: nucleoside deaminase [Pseudomonadales bacterium]
MDPTPEQILRHLNRCNEVAMRAMALGNHPFGAVLVGPDQETVLLEQGNINTVNHAESTLARNAATNFTPEYLWGCTLYTSVEPCCMCTGTVYWANIGRIVFGMTEADLQRQTGNHHENPTMDLPCRQVVASGQKTILVIGPVEESARETVRLQRDFWSTR